MNETSDIRWKSRVSFIFATSAAAIGLGNIWRFPYMAGQHGGSAFVLIYLLCVFILGVPLLIAEIVFGRVGRSNPARSFARLAQQAKVSKYWKWAGGLTILAGYLIVTYYVVITGWVIDYMGRSVIGEFKNISETTSIHTFKMLQHNYWEVLFTDTIVLLAAITVNILGIKRGLERAILLIFPALLLLLLMLLGYSATTGAFAQGAAFLFTLNLQQLTSHTILLALGQAFFSLNIAMGITMMFSAYLPKGVSIPAAAISVAIADTCFALLSGLIIFPIVFAYHLQPTAGPSLIFQTLPIAFGEIPAGTLIATLFFLMLFFAAFSSVIALLEPSISWLMETWEISRTRAVLLSAGLCWILSLGTIASFSFPNKAQLFGITFFKAIDYLTASIMLPIGGILIAIFAGWKLTNTNFIDVLGWRLNVWYKIWRFILRYFAPIAILFILLAATGIL